MYIKYQIIDLLVFKVLKQIYICYLMCVNINGIYRSDKRIKPTYTVFLQ